MGKIIIGLVGEKGGGKQAFADFFKEIVKGKKYSVDHIRFSDLLFETLNLWNIPTTRFNLQNLSIVMNKGYGDGTLTRAIIKRVENLKSDIVIVDGVRWNSDYLMIKDFPNSYLVYVTADVKLRYQRLKENSPKVNEKGVSFEQFMKEEKEKTEIEIPKIGAEADFRVENNTSLDELKEKVEEVIEKLNI